MAHTNSLSNALRSVALPDVVSAVALAQHLGRSPATVAAWFRSGALPGRRIGRSWYASRASLLQFLDGQDLKHRARLRALAGGGREDHDATV